MIYFIILLLCTAAGTNTRVHIGAMAFLSIRKRIDTARYILCIDIRIRYIYT